MFNLATLVRGTDKEGSGAPKSIFRVRALGGGKKYAQPSRPRQAVHFPLLIIDSVPVFLVK